MARRFVVWATCSRCGSKTSREEYEIELDGSDSDQEIATALDEAVQDLIANVVEAGWKEIQD